ncbi:tau-cadinol synthase-like [Triticum aestivum]|uniref:tau-cadinol synthase-like n=1 Tax=Triticum aestivum TaxID=4565 RepID=UPI001D00346F|nr:tau-cadinol synthase-like [Triticum aestivum]
MASAVAASGGARVCMKSGQGQATFVLATKSPRKLMAKPLCCMKIDGGFAGGARSAVQGRRSVASPLAAAAVPEKQSGSEPSPWSDFFTGYEPEPLQKSEEWMLVRANELKEHVCMMFKSCNNMATQICLLDTLQHLGIDYHFKEQIDTILSQILESEFFSSSSLSEVALGFRLLREHGHWVSPAHLHVHGEPTLEEAITFARRHLRSMRGSDLKTPLANQVKRALHIPLPRACKRIETLHYISEYKEEEGYNPVLLELAKLDFNLLQHVHLKELKAITEWWNNFSRNIGLSYIRCRVVESYTWAYVVYYQRGFKLPRRIIAMMIVLITTVDDTYDIHATIDDCRKLHEAIQSNNDDWCRLSRANTPPLSLIRRVQEYLKRLYMELLITFKNIEDEVPANVDYNVSYLRKAFQNHVSGYLQEAEWSHNNHWPKFEDQVNLTSLTVGGPTLSLSVMAGVDRKIMKQSLDWAAGVPDVVIAGGKIVRFMNDIAAFKRRKCKGDAASSVECYIHEHGVTDKVAIARIDELIEEEWKILNKARFENHALLPALQPIIDLARSSSLFYDNRNDVYTTSTHLQETVESLFLKPI